jgi:CRAL/TRIO domain
MTSWPWMKGIYEAISDPISNVNEYDKRPSVKRLLEENRETMEELKSALMLDPLYSPLKHDDLWILRFHLSHPKDKAAALLAAKKTLLFRHDRKLDETDIRFHPAGKNCNHKATQLYHTCCTNDAIQFVLPDPKRGVIGFVRLAGVDQHALVKTLDKSVWIDSFTYISEWSFQWNDYITRTTGLFTKSIRFIDMGGFTISGISMESLTRDGKAMEVMEDCYPQLLQGVFVCRSPVWIQMPWRICRNLLPKRVVSKMDFIDPENNESERNRLFQHISIGHLPSCYGGQYMPWPLDFEL